VINKKRLSSDAENNLLLGKSFGPPASGSLLSLNGSKHQALEYLCWDIKYVWVQANAELLSVERD
jgi:hypothetical protein